MPDRRTLARPRQKAQNPRSTARRPNPGPAVQATHPGRPSSAPRGVGGREEPSMLGRLFRLVIISWFVGMIAAAFAAMSVKRRLNPTTDESADEITAVAIFGPLAYHSTSQAFRGGEVECWY